METVKVEEDGVADIEAELVAVDAELNAIETQLLYLCERQNWLRGQKTLLTQQLEDKAAALVRRKAFGEDYSQSHFQWSSKLKETLNTVFRIKELRPYQLPTINATMAGNDCILVMPTGGGKSLCFQLPALLSPGVTIVVSPLISLMEDQVMTLQSRDIDARMLRSGMTNKEQTDTLKAMLDPQSKLVILYVTPERMSKSKRFMTNLQKMYEMGRFVRLAVDEVHCCSQWGHDFRRDYKILGVIKRQFPKVPILGLTATATARVTTDVQEMLNIQGCLVFRASFNRPNLIYKVCHKSRSQEEVNEQLARLINTSYAGQSGIIYCFSMRESEEVATELQTRGIPARPYHANLDLNYRSQIHRQWLSGKVKVVVATVAFGMGIDKPDVRFVIHHTISKSTENFYQESGRAGRDDAPADCIIFYRIGDVFRQSSMVFTETSGMKNLYGMVAYCIELKRCRRAILADHFGERWDSTKCDKKCDNCYPILTIGGSKNKNTEKVDVTGYCRDLCLILDKASSTKQRLTALKLMDAWFGMGATNLRHTNVKLPSHPRLECERIFAYFLLENYFEEEFHYTPHSTISYVKKGPRTVLLSKNDHAIQIEVLRGPTTTLQKYTASAAQGCSKKSASRDSVKSGELCATPAAKSRKPCVVNSGNSMFAKGSKNSEPSVPKPNKSPGFTKHAAPDSDFEQDLEKDFIFDDSDSSVEFHGIQNSKKSPKRRRLLINSDDD